MEFLRRTWAEIDIAALRHNFNVLKKLSKNSEITCVVKANSYGHDDNIIVPALNEAGCESYAVSNIEEAIHTFKDEKYNYEVVRVQRIGNKVICTLKTIGAING